MPVYAYKGMGADGRNVTGTKDGDSPGAVRASLRREGVFLTELKEASTKSSASSESDSGSGLSAQINFNFERIGPADLATATQQLSTLIGSGIPLTDAIGALVEQVEKESFQRIWANVRSKVNEGIGFSDALRPYESTFGNLYISMVKAGESSGALDVVLERLADFTRSQSELRGKLISTMVYPVIVMFIAVAVTAFLFLFVVPKLTPIFTNRNIELPLITSLVLHTSNFIQAYWWLIILVAVGAVWGFTRWVKTERGRVTWDAFVLRIPLFGPLIRIVAVARFARTLGTLTQSDVPLLKGFDIVRAVVQNRTLSSVIEDAREAVQKGDSIAAPLKRSGEFPPMITHMISVGEKTGRLEEMLNKAAESYEVQAENRIQAMTSVIEPAMIVVMGGVVLTIVLSILLPMMKLMEDF